MSWCKGRRSLLAAGAGAAALLASGCGFRPLYGSGSFGTVGAELAQVKIAMIPDRVGQQLHNYLLDRINRKGRPAKPDYLLKINISVQTLRLAFEPDSSATRAKLTFTANFRLLDIVTEKVLLKDFARAVTSYNIVTSAIATRSAELDATDRAAREVSEEIRALLAIYFQRRADKARA